MSHEPADRLRRRAAAGALSAALLAAAAVALGRSHGVGALSLLLFALAAVALAATDPWPRPDGWNPRGGLVRGPAAQPGQRRRMLALAVGTALAALVLGLVAYTLERSSIRAGASVAGPLAWGGSLLLALAAAWAARAELRFGSAWEAARLPSGLRPRLWIAAGAAALFAAAAAARLIALDSVPKGINADEGDRAAASMSLLAGAVPRDVFASGWYHISNIYFWLLAAPLKLFGVGFAEARLLGATISLLTLVVVVWIALRHFGHRVAILTALLGTVLGVSLQFARETTEATPTALLWALSIAFLLEGARQGAAVHWAAGGITGALSVFFYPTGRLWPILALAVLAAAVIDSTGTRRWRVVLGGGVTAMSALLAFGPFVAAMRVHPDELTIRARETSIFVGDNATRLGYADPHWSWPRLLWAQLERCLGLFVDQHDQGGFWPTGRPILDPVLAALTLLGLGWFTLSPRHLPRLTVALWFWVGFVGMVVTVETPNLQRMATAVPVIPLLAAGALDGLGMRAAAWWRDRRGGLSRARRVALAAACGIAIVLAAGEANSYFRTYARLDAWPRPTLQGIATADQGTDALVLTLGREFHQVNSGWVRLLAPEAHRGGMPSPGLDLPLAETRGRDLAFLLYPEQEPYLRLLRRIYPAGTTRRYTHPDAGLVVTVYRVARAAANDPLGALASTGSRPWERVATLGDVPATVERFPARIRWRALLRAPGDGNVQLRLSGSDATLALDGRRLLSTTRSKQKIVAISLARGPHLVQLDGIARSPSTGPRLDWQLAGEGWRRVAGPDLIRSTTGRGLIGTVAADGFGSQHRLDGTLADCCLVAEAGAIGAPIRARWSGSLIVPRTGRYGMSLLAEGDARLLIDGNTILHTPSPDPVPIRTTVWLARGRHTALALYRTDGSAGGIEWTWTPPGGAESIVPSDALRPPAGAGLRPPRTTESPAPPAVLVVEN